MGKPFSFFFFFQEGRGRGGVAVDVEIKGGEAPQPLRLSELLAVVNGSTVCSIALMQSKLSPQLVFPSIPSLFQLQQGSSPVHLSFVPTSLVYL